MERELSYDLHIHSCLSPCGDDDMTPGNIVGMAAIKGLDVIAVTDHNSCRNCPAVMKLAKQYGVDLDEHLLAVRSEAFAIRMGGRSARVAKQFIELCKSGVQV